MHLKNYAFLQAQKSSCFLFLVLFWVLTGMRKLGGQGLKIRQNVRVGSSHLTILSFSVPRQEIRMLVLAACRWW